MFTGIIEETGKVINIQKSSESCRIQISASKVLENTNIGDSIAVNGVCLTVTDMTKSSFSADVMAETVRRTSLAELKSGGRVNLERAMSAEGRFGGHIVSGHIDGTGIISDFKKEDNAVWITISADSSILKYIVEKGSVAIDGVSLTVAEITDKFFRVSIIPHTQSETTLISKKIGSKVNLECDIIGKYVEKLLFYRDKSDKKNGMTMDFLYENGFI
ncbi:MAG TPA: riboflavin synthase [Ruminococcus sp.]|nr:riboflavin synthase [Ruminococcus sp.]HCR73914.1 riboflavin synthase [Ruminococcus sp.]